MRNDAAIYLFGTSINDITGEVKFYTLNKNPEILFQPKTSVADFYLVIKLYVKYKNDFFYGVYPQKISFEY